MATAKKVVKEDFHTSSSSPPPNGPGGIVPDPVETGDVHANRAADQDQGEEEVAITRGGQEIPRSAMLATIIQQLMGMDNGDLSSIIAEIGDYKSDDATVAGVAAAPLENIAMRNLGSLTPGGSASMTREDVEELFAGEDLTEEYKERATVIFEAAVNARLAASLVALQEQAQADITEAVETITEEMTTQIDKYLTYAAEQFVEEHKAQLAEATRSTVAEQFVAGVVGLVEQFKIESDEGTSSKVAELEAALQEANAKLNEQVDASIELSSKIKSFEAKTAFDEVSTSLSPLQKARFSQLAESVEFDAVDSYKNRLNIIKESVAKVGAPVKETTLITEEVTGIQAAGTDSEEPKLSQDVHVRAAMSALSRLK
jgi:hypothetical protein